MATFDPQIVKGAGHFHNQIRKAFLCVTKNIFHNPTAFDVRNGVFNNNPCSGNDAVQPSVCLAQLLSFRFFWLECNHTFQLIPLEARIFSQGRAIWVSNGILVGYFFVMCFANHGWAEIQYLPDMATGQENIFVGMCFLLATVVFGLLFSISWTLPPSFCTVDQEIWRCFGYQWAIGCRFRIAFRGQAHLSQSLPQDG